MIVTIKVFSPFLYLLREAHKKRTDLKNLCAFSFCFPQEMVVILTAVWYNKNVKNIGISMG